MSNTLFIGKVLLEFDELSSTNDYARAWIAEADSVSPTKSRPPEGTVVRAASQSAGRGQFGSRWLASAGENLTFSLILYPNWLPIDRQFELSMALALACLLEDYWQIKWPNDIYVGPNKLAGTLIENTVKGQGLSSSVVGIGLNVNQLQFPSDLPNPTSMALESGHSFDLHAVLDRLLSNLEQRYLQLKAGKGAALREAYLERMYGFGEPRRFERADGAVFTGFIRGVSAEGRLLVENESEILAFAPKEIRFL